MSKIISRGENFQTFAKGFEQNAKSYYSTHTTFDGYQNVAYDFYKKNKLGYFDDNLFSHAVMGGYSDLSIKIEAAGDSIRFQYIISDFFGAGKSDAKKWTPGLAGMYYLQHYVKESKKGNTYNPFKWHVQIDRKIKK